MRSQRDGINPLAEPSGTGCKECLAAGSWWFHLRRCTECGHIGCCDSSPNQHATKHHHATGHPVIASFEPGERWFYDYRSGDFFNGPSLAAPRWHPDDQPVLPDVSLQTGQSCCTSKKRRRPVRDYAAKLADKERRVPTKIRAW